MAKLEKLTIVGIRSFGIDKDSEQSITFFSPVTLLVGPNGCGKTTIIESIKYAITGTVPNGTKKGAGFAADPNLHNVIELKAKVELSLLDSNGRQYKLIRVARNEKVKSELKFTCTDSTALRLNLAGNMEAISGRATDINALAQQIMGVPPAILNYVILCHQEDSLWPLNESSEVKKRFDEIFDSARYEKCIKKIREHYKELKSKIAVLDADVTHAQSMKSITEQKMVNLESKEKQLERLQQDLQSKQEELQPINKRLEEISEIEMSLLSLERERGAKENSRNNIIDNQTDIKCRLKSEFKGTDAELDDEIKQYNNRLMQNQKNKEELEHEKEELQVRESELDTESKKLSSRLGQIKEEMNQYTIQLQNRNALLDQLKDIYKCNFTVGNNTVDISAAVEEIKRGMLDEEKRYDDNVTSFNKSERSMQESVDSCKAKLIEAVKTKQMHEQNVRDVAKEIRELQQVLQELSQSDMRLDRLKRQLDECENDIKKLSATYNEKNMLKAIENDKKKMQELSAELEKLYTLSKVYQENSIKENEIENKKSEILRHESEIKKLTSEHYEEFQELLGGIPDKNVKIAVADKHRFNQNLINELQIKINSTQRDLDKAMNNQKYQEEALKKMELEHTQAKKQIQDMCKENDYIATVEAAKSRLSDIQENIAVLTSGKIVFNKFKDQLKETKCCPVCTTSFTANSDIKRIDELLSKQIKQLPGKLDDFTTKVKSAEEKYEKLLQLKPVYDKISELDVDIPKQTLLIDETKQKINQLSNELKTLKEERIVPERKLQCASSLLSAAPLLDQHRNDITNANNAISTLNRLLKPVEGDLSRQEVESKIEMITVDKSELQDKVDNNQKKMNQNSRRLQDLRDKRHQLVQEQLDIQKSVQSKPDLETRVEEKNKKQNELQQQIESLSETILKLKSDVDELTMNLDMSKESNRSTLNTQKEDIHCHKVIFGDLQKYQSGIQRAAEKKLQETFNNNLSKIAEIENEKKQVMTKKNTLASKIQEYIIEFSSAEVGINNLNDNKLLRAKGRELQQIEKDLAELKKKIGNYRYDRIRDEKQMLTRDKTRLDMEIQRSEGTIEEIHRTITDLKCELEAPVYKHSKTNYREAYVKAEITRRAKDEILSYSNAVESAVSKFHMRRLELINRNIRYLWRNIYKGNDIDYIEIRSEATGSNISRRCYNYKVVQVKKDKPLDMRGRCSAGQKVLASLIIRIALAEAFGVNCGIFTLDEPTTNLDKVNIESLGVALAALINTKSQQRNFQMIIITHDEEFIQTLKSVDSLRKYYFISRETNGNSRITLRTL